MENKKTNQEKLLTGKENNNFLLPKVKRFSFLTKSLIVGGIIVLVGGGVALATHFWNPSWNPFPLSPESVIKKMGERMAKLKTYHSKIKINATLNGNESAKISMFLDGNSDLSSPKEAKTFSTLEFQIEEIETGNKLSLKAKTISVGNDAYFNLEKLDLPLSLSFYMKMAGIDQNKIIGKWIKEKRESNDDLNLSQNKENEMRKKIKDLFQQEKIYDIKKVFPRDKINGKEAYHYLLSVNKDGLKKILPGLLKISEEYYTNNQPGNVYENIFQSVDFNRFVDDLFQKTGGLEADIWIGCQDFYLYRIRMNKKIDVSLLSDKLKGDIIVGIDIVLSNFNKKLDIKAPSKFIEEKSLMDILTGK